MGGGGWEVSERRLLSREDRLRVGREGWEVSERGGWEISEWGGWAESAHMSNGAMYSTNHLLVWQSNSSSPGIIPGQFHPSLLSEYPRLPELHRQSRDYPGMTTQPLGPLWQSIPEYQSYTGSPGIVPG